MKTALLNDRLDVYTGIRNGLHMPLSPHIPYGLDFTTITLQ